MNAGSEKASFTLDVQGVCFSVAWGLSTTSVSKEKLSFTSVVPKLESLCSSDTNPVKKVFYWPKTFGKNADFPFFFFCNWHATDIQCCIRSPYCWTQELLTLFRRPKKKFIPHSLYELSPPRSARVTPLRLYRRKHFHVTSLAPTTFMCFLSLCTVPYLIPLNLCRIYSKCSLIRNYLLIKYTSMSWIKADSRLRGQSSETHTGLIDCVILGKLLNLSGFFPFFSVPHEVAVNIRLKCPAHSQHLIVSSFCY